MPISVLSHTILTREELERAGGAFTVGLTIENPQVIEDLVNMGNEFERRAQAVFLRFVFQVHKFLIRLTPADTGRLRAGWTSILDKYNQAYDRQFFDTSLYDPWKQTTKDPNYHWDAKAIAEGKALSTFQDEPFNITIINNVPYGEHLEFGTSVIQGRHFVELARYKAELWFQVIFESWLKRLAEEGKITDLDIPDDQLEISA
jgi:hypothetical protein